MKYTILKLLTENSIIDKLDLYLLYVLAIVEVVL